MPTMRLMANIRSARALPETSGDALPAPGAPLTWCWHPPEELLAVFAGGHRALPDRRLCGLCGELVFVTPGA